MNTLLVFTVLFAGACMADVSHIVGKPPVAILEQVQDISPDGSFHNGFKSEDGIAVQAEGHPNGETSGRYAYTGTDGLQYEVTWTAGADGFNAQGPSVPATPEHVQRTLAYNAAHPYKEPAQR